MHLHWEPSHRDDAWDAMTTVWEPSLCTDPCDPGRRRFLQPRRASVCRSSRRPAALWRAGRLLSPPPPLVLHKPPSLVAVTLLAPRSAAHACVTLADYKERFCRPVTNREAKNIRTSQRGGSCRTRRTAADVALKSDSAADLSLPNQLIVGVARHGDHAGHAGHGAPGLF